MQVYPYHGLIALECDDFEMLCLCRPNSMLENLDKQFLAESGWEWNLSEGKNVILLKPHHANLIVREGKAKITQEKLLLGEIYQFLLDNDLLNTSQYIYV